MDRKLASIQRVKWLKPIEGADNIELAGVLGWQLVVAKSYRLKVNDLVIFFEVDSLLPVVPQFEFLAKNGTKKTLFNGKEVEGYRLKTVRLRGQVSQGLALPIGSFPEKLKVQHIWEEGFDVSELLGVVKYEAPVPEGMAGKMRGQFPSFIPKTDETRLQAYPELLEKYKDEQFYVTEKLDGSSVTFFIKDDEFHVCSRNTDLFDTPDNLIWRVAKEMSIEDKLRKMNTKTGANYALQGELVGGKVQGNKLKLSKPTIYFFSLFDLDKSEYVNFSEMFIKSKLFDFPLVPLITENFKLLGSVDDMVKFATRKSVINADVWVEGLVFRPRVEMRDEDLGRLSFKVINPEFLLGYGE